MVTFSPCHLVQLGISFLLRDEDQFYRGITLLYVLIVNYFDDVVPLISGLCQKANAFNQLVVKVG